MRVNTDKLGPVGRTGTYQWRTEALIADLDRITTSLILPDPSAARADRQVIGAGAAAGHVEAKAGSRALANLVRNELIAAGIPKPNEDLVQRVGRAHVGIGTERVALPPGQCKPVIVGINGVAADIELLDRAGHGLTGSERRSRGCGRGDAVCRGSAVVGETHSEAAGLVLKG